MAKILPCLGLMHLLLVELYVANRDDDIFRLQSIDIFCNYSKRNTRLQSYCWLLLGLLEPFRRSTAVFLTHCQTRGHWMKGGLMFKLIPTMHCMILESSVFVGTDLFERFAFSRLYRTEDKNQKLFNNNKNRPN